MPRSKATPATPAASASSAATQPLSFTRGELENIAADALAVARRMGAAQAGVEVSEGSGLSVSVRKGAVETLEHNRDKGLGITVYTGKPGALSRGNASTSDFSKASIEATVRAAFDIARFTAPDDCAGLAEPELLAKDAPDLDLYHPWALDAEHAIALALRMERAALATDKRISNTDGTAVSASQGQFILATTHGFMDGYPYSRQSLSIAPIAKDRSGMQRDDWYVSERRAEDLAEPERVGRYAAERALARLRARKLDTRKCPVLFEAPLACGLLGSFVQAASGGALYRDASFFVGKMGEQVLASHIDILEDPHVPGAIGSCFFDDEGVATKKRTVLEAGVLKGWFLSTYTARKLKLPTTGNAGGSHNLSLTSRLTQPGDNFAAMLRKMGCGLLVTELLGQGVNYVNGDYSRGASGYWVENGVIQYPVEEITIAGNMAQMFKDIAAVGADVLRRGTKVTGSILISEMAIAGN
jgi:PmbA protein